MAERLYMPTLADLIDRLSICLMKSIFIEREVYRVEIAEIGHDIDLILAQSDYKIDARDVYAILVIMLANRFIWENESQIRTTPMNSAEPYGYREIAQKLIGTHSINGVRNFAKNKLMQHFGGRQDLKIDCLAADLPPEFGNWRVYE